LYTKKKKEENDKHDVDTTENTTPVFTFDKYFSPNLSSSSLSSSSRSIKSLNSSSSSHRKKTVLLPDNGKLGLIPLPQPNEPSLFDIWNKSSGNISCSPASSPKHPALKELNIHLKDSFVSGTVTPALESKLTSPTMFSRSPSNHNIQESTFPNFDTNIKKKTIQFGVERDYDINDIIVCGEDMFVEYSNSHNKSSRSSTLLSSLISSSSVSPDYPASHVSLNINSDRTTLQLLPEDFTLILYKCSKIDYSSPQNNPGGYFFSSIVLVYFTYEKFLSVRTSYNI
jgi:hypothetical protein